MSARQFRGMLCVYCRRRPATTGDHIFSRQLFVVRSRGNLPQVPACQKCNNHKSRLENDLTAVLPFGARRPDAHENLVEQVPKRLAKNLRLHRELSAGRGHIWHMENGVFRPTMTIPVDPKMLRELFSLTACALVWYHWRHYLLPEHDSEALQLTRFGVAFFDRLFAMNAASRVQNDLGKQTVRYSGAQAVDTPQLTLWRIQLYGGIAFSGDGAALDEVSTEMGAITGPRRLVALLAGCAEHKR
jgi:hypothetical protein